ncbi:MAG: Lrp/AsnC family transcriptional regulator [Pseudomonadota bacterium]|nr:Lrp/AsnC family transcriptional regulator [Pseudomonadota bacterium]
MDSFDIRIIDCLQRDASMSLSDIAEAVGLSSTPCWRRIHNMEQAGVIQARVAILDPVKLNVGVTVFVAIKTAQHSADWLVRFARHVDAIEEVVEFYRMSGDVDYMLRVVVPDISAYDAVYKRLIEVGGLSDVNSTFTMERIKYTTALPLSYAN